MILHYYRMYPFFAKCLNVRTSYLKSYWYAHNEKFAYVAKNYINSALRNDT